MGSAGAERADQSTRPSRASRHAMLSLGRGPSLDGTKNNIGLLRLLFASLVIIGHAPEMIDGNYAREPLFWLTGSMSLGQLAVDGFFMLSGYLITASMIHTNNLFKYMERRVVRIYPAFLVAFLISVAILGTAVGSIENSGFVRASVRALALQPPAGIVPGLRHEPFLNGPMWTIAYEFRCYILVALMWAAGLLVRRRLLLWATAALTIGAVLAKFFPPTVLDARIQYSFVQLLTGLPSETIRLTAVFMLGVCVCFYWDEIRPHLTKRNAALCAVASVVFMYRNPYLSEAVLTLLGGFVLIWAAMIANLGPVQRINDRWDISYGVYLYGWPIAIYIRWAFPSVSPWALVATTLPAAYAAGWLSWHLVERPVRDRVRHRRRSVDRAVQDGVGDQRDIGTTADALAHEGRTTKAVEAAS
jgi:peptidoglycan/LPS O-acetylase OafA/YrhL